MVAPPAKHLGSLGSLRREWITPPLIQKPFTRKLLYLIGSLRNPEIPALAQDIRKLGYDVFDDWHAAGPTADDEWKRYSLEKGQSYQQALDDYAAKHVFDFDLHYLQRAQVGVLVLPAGRSGHLELGYIIGRGYPGYVLLDNPERWDVMYQFCEQICFSKAELLEALNVTT